MNLSRRAMILSIALALGVGAYFKFAEESYSSFYRSHLEKNRREIISREEFLESYAPTQEERLTLDEKILSSREGLEIIKATYFKGSVFDSLSVETDTFNEYQRRSRKTINEFLSFVGFNDRTPRIEFKILTKETLIESPRRDFIPIYTVHEIFDCPLMGDYQVKIGKIQTRAYASGEVNFGGGFNLNVGVSRKEKDSPVYQEKISPIVVSAGINAVKSYNSPPAEIFHYLLRDHTLRNMNAHIRSSREERREELPDALIKEIIEDEIRKEEGIVHAALNIFVENNRRKIGVTLDEIDHVLISEREDPHYRYVPGFRKQMEREGCAKIIREYCSPPNKKSPK